MCRECSLSDKVHLFALVGGKMIAITDCITEENKLGFKRVLYKFVLKYFHQNQNLVIFHTNRHHIPPVHWLYCKTIMVRK